VSPEELRPVRVTIELNNCITEVINIGPEDNGTRAYSWNRRALGFNEIHGKFHWIQANSVVITWDNFSNHNVQDNCKPIPSTGVQSKPTKGSQTPQV
jgi:hypothetical protein